MEKLYKNFSSAVIRSLAKSLNWKVNHDQTKDRGVLYALFHGHSLCVAMHGIDKGIYTLVSEHKDGNIAALILESIGFNVIRGSTENGNSLKGGSRALLKLVKILKEQNNIAITVDGPKGPIYHVNPGIIYLSIKANAPIVPIFAKASKKIELSSWDKFIIPIPFSTCTLNVGKPYVPDKERPIEELQEELKQKMLSLDL